MHYALKILACSGLAAAGIACHRNPAPDATAPATACATPDSVGAQLLSTARWTATDTGAVARGVRRVLHPEVELDMPTRAVRDDEVCAAIADAIARRDGTDPSRGVHVVAVGPYFWARTPGHPSNGYYVFDAALNSLGVINVRQ